MIKNIFSSRIGVFAIMVIVSTLSWIYVTAAESRIDTFPGQIPITVKNVSEGLVAITDTEGVEVRLRADARTWSLLTVDSFTAQADLKGLGAGTHEVPIVVAVALPSVQVVEKNPATLRVRLEESVSKDVPVRVVVQGEVAAGRAPGEPVANPNRVLVIGPKSVVAAVSDAQAVVTLGGEATDVQRTIRLQVTGRRGEPVGQIRFEPTTVGVAIPIVQASNVKTVGVRVVTTGQPKEGFYVQKVAVSPATVSITGGAGVDAIDTTPIDLTNLATTKTFTVDLVFPTGSKSADSPTRATVILTVSSVPTNKQVPLTYTFSDLDPSLKLDSVNPAAGSVVLIGSAEALSGISGTSATLSLAGRAAGTHSLNVAAENVQAPAGTTVSGTPTPTAISVTLSQK